MISSVLQCVPLLQRVVVSCNVLQCVTVCCSQLPHDIIFVAACSGVLQCALLEVYCSALPCVAVSLHINSFISWVLQCVVESYSAL